MNIDVGWVCITDYVSQRFQVKRKEENTNKKKNGKKEKKGEVKEYQERKKEK